MTKNELNFKKFLNSKQASEMLGCTKKALYARVYRGELPYFKTGTNNSKILFDPVELEAIVRKGRVEPIRKGATE